MNTENFQKNEAAAEVGNGPEITSSEQGQGIQERGEEAFIQIEKEFSLVAQDNGEVGEIDSSVALENKSIEDNIKNQLGLEEKLDQLNSEAENIKEEAKSKISEITGLDKKTTLELSEFSRRYSAFYRDRIAQKIIHLRFLQQSKLKERPLEIESLGSSISSDEILEEKTREEKLNNKELQKNIQEQRNKLNLEINELKENLNKRKNSFIYKIQRKFSQHMNIDEDTIELFESEGLNIKDMIEKDSDRKDFELAKIIKDKKDSLKNLDLSLGEIEEKIKKQINLLEKLKNSIKDKYESLKEAEKIINSDFEIKEIEKEIVDFYNEMAFQKKIIESEKKERSVKQISKDKNVLFCHAIPMAVIPKGLNNFSKNNKLINTHNLGPEKKIKMILGIEPTLSVSTIDKEHQVLAGDFGLILKEGTVLSAYNKDAGTALNNNIYDRKAKYDNNLKTSTIQNNIKKNIDDSIESKQDRDRWNELVVENPKVAGLFYQINVDKTGNSFASFGTSMNYAHEISKNLNLPLYILDGDKVFQKDEITNELKEINRDDLFTSSRYISNFERKKYIGEVIDAEAFSEKRENLINFKGYNDGIKDFSEGKVDFNSYIKEKEKELQNSYRNIKKMKKEGEEFSLQQRNRYYLIFMDLCRNVRNLEI